MPRLPYIAREDLPKDQRHMYEDIAQGRGHVPHPFKLLLHSPGACAHVSALGQYVRFKSSLSAPVRELAILVVSRHINCDYEFSYHEPVARKVGVSEAAINAAKFRKSTVGLPSHEAAVIRFSRSLVQRYRASDATYRAIEKMLGVQGAVDLAVGVGYYWLLGVAMDTLGVTLEPEMKSLLPK